MWMRRQGVGWLSWRLSALGTAAFRDGASDRVRPISVPGEVRSWATHLTPRRRSPVRREADDRTRP